MDRSSERLNEMQAAHYDGLTNMGAGILRGIEELTGSRGRPIARKVMFVLTDGNANVAADGSTRCDVQGGKRFALEAAEEAARNDIQIFTVSVGSGADRDLMAQIAEIGGGDHFHAEGSIDQYSDQLDQIFAHLGGQRPIALIE